MGLSSRLYFHSCFMMVPLTSCDREPVGFMQVPKTCDENAPSNHILAYKLLAHAGNAVHKVDGEFRAGQAFAIG